MGSTPPLAKRRSFYVLYRVVISVAVIWAGTGARAATAVHWYSTIGEASAHAVPVNRPMMIDFWADWCAPCEVMQKEVYSSPDFRKAAETFLPVRIDFDKNPDLIRKYNIEALPTIVFTDSYGNELFRYRGYMGAKPLLALVEALPSDVTEFNRLNKILARDKNNFEALESMGKSLRAAGLFRPSSSYYAKAAQRPEAKSDPETREAILNEIGLNFLEVQDAKLAAASFEKCLREFPNSTRKSEWTLNLGQAYSYGGKKDREKAKTILQTFIRSHPPASESEKARKILTSL